jgi:hypothetical protein
MFAQSSPVAGSIQQETSLIPTHQLDSVAVPIALYANPMLAQVLAASTYPLEIVQLQQWLPKRNDLKDRALVDGVQKEDWHLGTA